MLATGLVIWSFGLSESFLDLFRVPQETVPQTTAQSTTLKPTTIAIADQFTATPDPVNNGSESLIEKQNSGQVEEDEIIFDNTKAPATKTQPTTSTQSKNGKGKKPAKRGSAGHSYKYLMKSGEKAREGEGKASPGLFKKAQKLKPKNPTPLAQLAWCKLAAHQTKAALPLFKQALALSAGHADSLYGLGYAYESWEIKLKPSNILIST